MSKGEEWGMGKCLSETSIAGREESEQTRGSSGPTWT